MKSGEERDWEPLVSAWRRRLAAEEDAQQAIARVVHAAAKRGGSMLVDRFGVRRVYLFGSLTGQAAAPFGPRSDVDLAVAGLSPDCYWRALAALEAEFPPGIRVDLVRLESADASLVEHVLRSAEVIAG